MEFEVLTAAEKARAQHRAAKMRDEVRSRRLKQKDNDASPAAESAMPNSPLPSTSRAPGQKQMVQGEDSVASRRSLDKTPSSRGSCKRAPPPSLSAGPKEKVPKHINRSRSDALLEPLGSGRSKVQQHRSDAFSQTQALDTSSSAKPLGFTRKTDPNARDRIEKSQPGRPTQDNDATPATWERLHRGGYVTDEQLELAGMEYRQHQLRLKAERSDAARLAAIQTRSVPTTLDGADEIMRVCIEMGWDHGHPAWTSGHVRAAREVICNHYGWIDDEL